MGKGFSVYTLLKYLVLIEFALLCNKAFSSNQDTIISQIDFLIDGSNEYFLTHGKDAVIFDSILQQAFQLADKNQLKSEVANIYQIIGKRYRNRSDYGNATQYFQRAVAIAVNINDIKLKAYSTHEIAVVLRRINNPSKALQYHNDVLNWAREISDTFLIHSSLNGIGNIYISYHEYKKAIEYFQESLKYTGSGDKKNWLGEAINSNNIGEAYLYMRMTDSALYYFTHSLTINTRLGSAFGKAICHNSLGKVYEELQEYPKALDYYLTSLRQNMIIGDLIYTADNYRNIGTVYLKMGKLDDAELNLLKGIELSRQIGGTYEEMHGLEEMSQLYVKRKDFQKAFQATQRVLNLKDSITTSIQKINSEVLTSLNNVMQQEKELQLLKKEAELSQLKLQRQKTFLIIGIVLLAFIMLVTIVLLNQRRLQNRLNRLTLEQRLFRSQLNPHFIFNSLAAMQNFVINNDKLAAFDYLSDFASLMRSILMGSRKDEISLHEEMETLDIYIRLQQLRFQNAFDYQITCGECLDREQTLLPPMIIQPFVENAIEHGLRPLKTKGSLQIRFECLDEKLVVSVEDNGVGFQAKDSTTSEKHVSMATKITKERLFVIESITKQHCYLDIVNKSDVSGENGVKVVIHLPLKTM